VNSKCYAPGERFTETLPSDAGAAAPGTHESVATPGRYTELGARIVIVLGVVLLIIGFVFHVPIIWTLGILAIVVGAILALVGAAGREIGGRRHWY
jgi:protein-S-isoprenylcysteine O-methyltransferase Ste14